MPQSAYVAEEPPAPGAMTPIVNGVHWLRMPLPFQVEHINLWVLDDGDGWVLVDSGVDSPPIREAWEQLIAGPLAGRPLKRLIVTHMHPDHFGLAGWLGERWRVPLHMTAEEYYTGRSLTLSQWDEYPWEIQDYFRRAGVGDAEIEEIKKLGYGNFSRSIYRPPAAFHRLQDGDRLEIGGRDWRVVVGRGHSPEHACLHCPDLGLLISGDQVLPQISSNVSVASWEPDANPLKLWLESLEKLKKLPQDTLVLPAHGDPFTGLHRRLNALIRGHEDRLRLILKHAAAPVSVAESLKAIFRRELTGFSRILAIGEAMAHFHLLLDRGLMTAETDPHGVRRFQTIEGDRS